ncbi:thiosulfate sulfurtransferase PspE [bacterium MnTg03]|nr:thiosulfate sulfurtransferase PspE [bacterium MnTg03]
MSLKIDPKQIIALSPINSLNPENVRELLSKITALAFEQGFYIFKIGDTEKNHVYVLEGEIELVKDKKVVKLIKAGTPEALQPISPGFPRAFSARAKGSAVVTKIDSDMLDIMLTWDQTGSYMVDTMEDDDETDWMSRILQTPAFHRIPAANIQAIFLRMESVKYSPGDKVIEQDQEGDYFYIIEKGRCLVTRATPANPNGVKLATLSVGDSFGEEALISDSTRNATVTMLSAGHLMRLKKEDFNSLLNEPLLNWVSYEEGKKLVEGGGVWLDVRLPDEHKAVQIKGSINIPLIFLRMKASSLDKNQKYVLYCDTGRRSSAASFLLNEKEIESFVLTDGIDSAAAEDLAS